MKPASPASTSGTGLSSQTEISTALPLGSTTTRESKSYQSKRIPTSMVCASVSTTREVIVGTKSHCSGVTFRRTAPPWTVRTP